MITETATPKRVSEPASPQSTLCAGPDALEPEGSARAWMERMRTSPGLLDYCYFTARTNLAVLERAVKRAGKAPRVVDIGCGRKPFQKLFPAEANYFGIDFDERTRADLVHDLSEPLPLPHGMADVVILSEVIEHVSDPELVVAEAARLLKPGGELYLSAPFAFPIHGRPWDYQRFTDYFYRRLSERHPLRLVELQASNNVFSTPLLLCNQVLLSVPRVPMILKHLGWGAINAVAGMLEIMGTPWSEGNDRLGLFLRMNPSGYAMRFRKI